MILDIYKHVFFSRGLFRDEARSFPTRKQWESPVGTGFYPRGRGRVVGKKRRT